MDKKIIKLPIGDIKNNFTLYQLKLVNNKIKVKVYDDNISKFFYFTLFLLIGLPFTILSPFKTFNFFYKKTRLYFFSDIYMIKNNRHVTSFNPFVVILYLLYGKKIRFVFYYLFSVIICPYYLFKFCITGKSSFVSDYDWTELYKKLKTEGYNPQKNSYIKVSKYKNYYICNDGNHRHKILESFFSRETMVDVIYEGQVFDN